MLPYVVCGRCSRALIVMGRAWLESRRELAAGRAALAGGDAPEAIRRLRRTAHWYLPANPNCQEAYAALESIATQAESQGRNDDAAAAWRAIRASALATRWLYVPHRSELERANRHLAALMVAMRPPSQDPDINRARLRDEYLALLSENTAPEPAWVIVMGLGFFVWLGAAFWAARNGWSDDDVPRRHVLAWAGGLVALGMALFVLGIARA